MIRPDLRRELNDFARAVAAVPDFNRHRLRWERLVETLAQTKPGEVTADELMEALEERLQTVGDDAQMAQFDLQNALRRTQRLLQMMSEIMKKLHESSAAIISNLKA